MSNNPTGWPVVAGSYVVGDPKGPVAVCTLTSEKLMGPLAKLPGVAISGMVYTANLGITRIIMNVTTNPSIRFLLICGRDSPLFKPGQSLVSLHDKGVDDQLRIIGASGYEPVLQTLNVDQIGQFRKQVEVVDWTGEEDLKALERRVNDLSARNPGRFETAKGAVTIQTPTESFVPIRPGGQREPLIYDPKGYFVISVEPEKEEIVLRHYLPDHKPAHEMRGRGATSMLLGLLRDGLVTQLSHAGYLGEELAKAQAALQFNLRYDQDRPLRLREVATGGDSQASQQGGAQNPPTPQGMPSKPIALPFTLKQLEDASPGTTVNITITVMELSADHKLTGMFLESDEAEPFNVFHRTQRRVEANWTTETKMIMGQESEIQPQALLRVAGKLDEKGAINASQIVILTRVGRIKS
jgi:tetrahydromethanopterin S-methyltransferase subunit A